MDSIYKRVRKEVDSLHFPDTSVEELVAELLDSVRVAHILHLNTEDYELHKTLDEYYKDLPELVDVLAEATIGLNTSAIPFKSVELSTPQELVRGIYNKCCLAHRTAPPALSNPLEDVMTFLAQILYKLRLH